MSDLNFQFETTTLILLNSVFVSLEKKIVSSDSEKFHLYGRGGFGFMNFSTFFFCGDQSATGGIAGLTMLTGKGNHHFELNAGGFIGTFRDRDNNPGIVGTCDEMGFQAFPVVEVGYRRQKPEGGFVLRVKIGTLGVGLGLGHAF